MDNSENHGIKGKYSFPLCGGLRGSHIDTLDIELELDSETVFEIGEYFMSEESSSEVDTDEWGIKDSLDEDYSATALSSLLKEWGLFGRLLRRAAEEYLADADTEEDNESLADGILESLSDKISESTEEIISDLNDSYFLDDYFDFAKECMYETIPEHEIICEAYTKYGDCEDAEITEIDMTLTTPEIIGILAKRIGETDLFERIEMKELPDVATLIDAKSLSMAVSTNIDEVLESDEFFQELANIIKEFLNCEIDEDELQSRNEDSDYL